MPKTRAQAKMEANVLDDAPIPQNANGNEQLVMHVALPNLFAPGGGGGGGGGVGRVRPLAHSPDTSARASAARTPALCAF